MSRREGPITPQEHRQLVAAESRGEALFGIDTTAARKFFTDVSLSEIEESIGDYVFMEKVLVKGSFYLGPLFLLGAVLGAVVGLRWWSLLAAPAMILFWMCYYSSSSLGTKTITSGVILLAAAMGAAAFVDTGGALKASLVLFGAALFLARFMYRSATVLLRNLVVRNWKAFERLDGTALLVRHVNP